MWSYKLECQIPCDYYIFIHMCNKIKYSGITFIKYSLLFLNQISFQIYIYIKHHCTTVQSLQILDQQQQN
jgi:hypothetical protein